MEELKLIIETVAKLGEEGKSAFIWYLFMTHGLSTLCWLGFFGALGALARIFAGTLVRLHDDSDTLQRVVAAIYGYERHSLDRNDRDALLRRIHQLTGNKD